MCITARISLRILSVVDQEASLLLGDLVARVFSGNGLMHAPKCLPMDSAS